MLFAIALENLVNYGYAGIILYMILTGCGLPMPEEVAIIAGGVLAAKGTLDWRLTLGALLIGAILGDTVMYLIGRYFGRRLLNTNPLWKRLITPDREKRVEELLVKHGAKVLFGARFLVGLRGPMYITAGILKVPFRRFIIADMVCATVVVTLFFALTYFYGAQIMNAIHKGEGWFTIAVIGVAIVTAGIGIWYYFHRKKTAPSAEAAPTASSPSTELSGFLAPIPAAAANGQPTNQATPAAEGVERQGP
jgi:membrane protein DedA with SNARE-associated domain